MWLPAMPSRRRPAGPQPHKRRQAILPHGSGEFRSAATIPIRDAEPRSWLSNRRFADLVGRSTSTMREQHGQPTVHFSPVAFGHIGKELAEVGKVEIIDTLVANEIGHLVKPGRLVALVK